MARDLRMVVYRTTRGGMDVARATVLEVNLVLVVDVVEQWSRPSERMVMQE